MSKNLDKKFEFLKTVKMPSRATIFDCLKEYEHYKSAENDAGKYGYFVGYKVEDMDNEHIREYRNIILIPQQKLLNAEIEKMNATADKAHQISIDTDYFTHIRIGNKKPIECRLYLRILPSNVHKLARALTQECFKRRLPTHFKFDLNRNDSFVIYTDYDHCQEFVDVIKKIKQEQPKLFKNAEKLHPLWGNIEDFIGFMEEPKIEAKNGKIKLDKSASTYRTKLFQDITTHPSFKGLKNLTTSHLKRFAEPLDIDPEFLALNASSVQELKAAGYDVSLIGRGTTSTAKADL